MIITWLFSEHNTHISLYNEKFTIGFTFLLCSHTMHAMVFSDWAYETVNGNTIGDAGVPGLLTKTNKELSNLERWYFYEDHIIGEYDTFINPEYKTAYFILNELNGELKTYLSKDLFEKDLQAKELKPVFWTRWYHDHYPFIQIMYFLWLFYLPIALFLILLICGLIILSITLKNKILKISCIVLTSILLVPALLAILNDHFTGSI